jgi:hypothetical protein
MAALAGVLEAKLQETAGLLEALREEGGRGVGSRTGYSNVESELADGRSQVRGKAASPTPGIQPGKKGEIRSWLPIRKNCSIPSGT